MLTKLTLKSLETLDDGRIREAVNQALRRCEDDCRDRPGVKQNRSVTISINLEPQQCGETGTLDSVDIAIDIKEKIPARKSKRYNALAKGHGLFFNEASPEDVDQLTLDEAAERRPQLKKGEAHAG